MGKHKNTYKNKCKNKCKDPCFCKIIKINVTLCPEEKKPSQRQLQFVNSTPINSPPLGISLSAVLLNKKGVPVAVENLPLNGPGKSIPISFKISNVFLRLVPTVPDALPIAVSNLLPIPSSHCINYAFNLETNVLTLSAC
jgi:hypothetical protein